MDPGQFQPSNLTQDGAPLSPALTGEIWQTRILGTILKTLVALVLIAYLPGMWAAITTGFVSVAIIDTVALAWFAYLLFARRLSVQVRAVGLIIGMFALSVGLVVVLGVAGAGFLWLLGTCSIAGILFGRRGAAIVCLGIVVVVAGLAIWTHDGGVVLTVEASSTLLWIIHGTNTVLLGAMIAAASHEFAFEMRSSLQNERSARRDLEQQKSLLDASNRSLEEEIRRSLVHRQRIATLQYETEHAFLESIRLLARAGEIHDEGTQRHVERVNEYAWLIASGLDVPQDFRDTIRYSAQLHDVGKMSIDVGLLQKQGRLTPDQRLAMQRHTKYGWSILSVSERLSMAAEIALSHHERWDGTGYPQGLAGEAIPLSARIVALGDMYDALRSRRPYKAPLSHGEAVAIMLGENHELHRATHFDPTILARFRDRHPEFDEVYRRLTR